MSFFKSLFGGKPAGPAGPVTTKSIEYKGYRIDAQPYAEGGQFQVAGLISKDVDGARREHRFVRADRFPGQDDAAEFSLTKAKQIIDQQGDALFQAPG